MSPADFMQANNPFFIATGELTAPDNFTASISAGDIGNALLGQKIIAISIFPLISQNRALKWQVSQTTIVEIEE